MAGATIGILTRRIIIVEALRSEENHGRGDLKITGWRMRWLMRGWCDHWVVFHADPADLAEFSIIC